MGDMNSCLGEYLDVALGAVRPVGCQYVVSQPIIVSQVLGGGDARELSHLLNFAHALGQVGCASEAIGLR